MQDSTETTPTSANEVPNPPSPFAKVRRFLPATAFALGFLWDVITLGRVVKSSDLWILGFYYLGAFAGVLLLLREWKKPAVQTGITMLVQFCFGGLFSALVVLYFKSSGHLGGFLVVIGMVGLLVVNEFLQRRYARSEIAWSLLCVTGIMYLNFLLPHLVHGVSVFWFLLSSLSGFAVILLPWKLSGKRWFYLLPPFAVTVLLVSLYFARAIPPVPLVIKQHLVCKNFEKTEGGWFCMEETQPWTVRMGFSSVRIHHANGEKIYYLSSVFAPSRVQADLVHRWFYFDTDANWNKKDTMPMSMIGGRDEGWRLYSNKAAIQPGRWRVETALQGGAVIGRMEFVVPAETEPADMRYTRRQLR